MPDIGATLREARTRANVDIGEVETATKIRAKYLRAMENEEWHLLPGPTFVKSFLRTYAEYLGLDARMLVDEYKLRHEPVPEPDHQPLPAPIGREPRARLRAPTLPRGWAIGLSVAGVLALLIVLGSIGEEEDPTQLAPATETARQPAKPGPAAPQRRRTRVALRLMPTGVVYVCLRNAADELVLSDTLQAGQPSQIYRGRRFRLTVGNQNIEMQVNGRTLKVPPTAQPLNYEFTPRGRKRLPDEANQC